MHAPEFFPWKVIEYKANPEPPGEITELLPKIAMVLVLLNLAGIINLIAIRVLER
jgi:hypothetical protein